MALPSHSFPPEHPDEKGRTYAFTHLRKSRRKRRSQVFEERLSTVDEVPDFHDPFSDLNLFLFKHLKRALPNLGFPKRWSLKLQDSLIKAISPEFRKNFPLYRLGVTALKKAFEKLLSFSEVVEHEREAFSQDGKLRISFLIKENLKQFEHFKTPSYLKPYHLAHKLAMKIGECLAVVDGRRPKIDILAKTVWSILRHLLKEIKPEETRSPYDNYDKVDQLIVKIILEQTTKTPSISEHDLQLEVKETLHSLSDLPVFSSNDQMQATISALIAHTLYDNSPLSPQDRLNASTFIKKQIKACRRASPSTQRAEIVMRTAALYSLASTLPKDLSDELVLAGAKTLYPTPNKNRPPLGRSVYAFLASQLVLMGSDIEGDVLERLVAAYKEATHLPPITSQDTLDILIWKELSERENLLSSLSYAVGRRIEEEIAGQMIDNPNHSFAHLVSHTLNFFRQIKELSSAHSGTKTEEKIRLWTLQSDMLQRWIHLDEKTPLLLLIKKAWNIQEKKGMPVTHDKFIHAVTKAYLRRYPDMALYASHLKRRATTLYKYCFFNCFGDREESSLDRLIAWHTLALQESSPNLTREELQHKLQEIITKRVPLIPSSLIHCA